MAPHLVDLGLGGDAADAAALIVMTLLIAYLSLVLGELVPKRLALQRSAGLSMITAPVLDRFATLMRPVIWLLSVSTDAVVRLLRGDPEATSEQVSRGELHDLVTTAAGPPGTAGPPWPCSPTHSSPWPPPVNATGSPPQPGSSNSPSPSSAGCSSRSCSPQPRPSTASWPGRAGGDNTKPELANATTDAGSSDDHELRLSY